MENMLSKSEKHKKGKIRNLLKGIFYSSKKDKNLRREECDISIEIVKRVSRYQENGKRQQLNYHLQYNPVEKEESRNRYKRKKNYKKKRKSSHNNITRRSISELKDESNLDVDNSHMERQVYFSKIEKSLAEEIEELEEMIAMDEMEEMKNVEMKETKKEAGEMAKMEKMKSVEIKETKKEAGEIVEKIETDKSEDTKDASGYEDEIKVENEKEKEKGKLEKSLKFKKRENEKDKLKRLNKKNIDVDKMMERLLIMKNCGINKNHLNKLMFDDANFLLKLMEEDNTQSKKRKKQLMFKEEKTDIHKTERASFDTVESLKQEKQTMTNIFGNKSSLKNIMKEQGRLSNEKEHLEMKGFKQASFRNLGKKGIITNNEKITKIEPLSPNQPSEIKSNRNADVEGKSEQKASDKETDLKKNDSELNKKQKKQLTESITGEEPPEIKKTSKGDKSGKKEKNKKYQETSSEQQFSEEDEIYDKELQKKLLTLLEKRKKKMSMKEELEGETTETDKTAETNETEVNEDVYLNDVLLSNKMRKQMLNDKLNVFNNLIKSIEPCRSYNIDEGHPLYNFLCRDENSFLSSNWHDRINFAFRNIWNLEQYINEEASKAEKEKMFFSELEAFHMSCKIGACGLIYSLFLKGEEIGVNIQKFKKCFIKLTQDNYSSIYKIYKPKFDNDLLFLFDSIVFTVVLGNKANNVNCNTARKVYNNDIKGKNALCECIFELKNTSRFSLPIANQIDYMGIRVIAEPLMPLNHEAIPVDIVKQIFDKMEWNDLEETSMHKNHNAEGNENEKKGLNVKNKDHIKNDYDDSNGVRFNWGDENCTQKESRIQQIETQKMEGKKEKKKQMLEYQIKKKKKELFYERIYVELAKFDGELYSQLRKMGNHLNLKCCILPFGVSNYFLCNILKKKNNVKIYKSRIDNLYVIRGAEEILPPFLGKIKNENYLTRLRYEFIKYFNIDKMPLSNTTLALDIQCNNNERATLTVHDLMKVGRESLNNLNTYVIPQMVQLTTQCSDSYDITYLYHSHGINIINLGYLIEKENCPQFFKDILCREIVCRTLKSIFVEHVHEFLKKVLNTNNAELTKNKDEINKKQSQKKWIIERNELLNKYFHEINSCKKKDISNICYCDRCFLYWNYFPELVPHEFLIRLTNLTLNVTNYTSIQFWNDILFPYCLKKYQVDIKEYINISEIQVYSFLQAIEYHFGVFFKTECKKNGRVKLPLSLDDLSDFTSKNETLLFPNISKLKNIFDMNRKDQSRRIDKRDKREKKSMWGFSNPRSNDTTVFGKRRNDKLSSKNYLIRMFKKMMYANSDNTNRKNFVNSPRDKNGIKKNNFLKGLQTSIEINDKKEEIIKKIHKKESTLEIKKLTEQTTGCYPYPSITNKKNSESSGNRNESNNYDDYQIINVHTNNIDSIKNRSGTKSSITNSSSHNDKMDNFLFAEDSENFEKGLHEKNSFILFYPKSDMSVPRYSTWTYKKIENVFSKIIVQEKFKIKTTSEDNILNIMEVKKNGFLNINSICTMGMCSQIRSSIYVYNIPCNPYCVFNEKMRCINYDKAKKSILLLLSININKNVFEIAKIFLFLAYLHFEHGYIDKCIKTCYYIYSVIPELGIIKKDFLILVFQCKLKERKLEDALMLYKMIKNLGYFLEGEYSISTLLCNLILANFYNHMSSHISCSNEIKKSGNEQGKTETTPPGDAKTNNAENWNIGKGNITEENGLFLFDNDRLRKKNIERKKDSQNKKRYEKEQQMMMDDIDKLEIKNEYVSLSLHYSKECYKAVFNIFNDINSHWIYVAVLILYGNCLMALRQFSKATEIFSLSLKYSVKGKLPPFIILQNKCLLVDALKGNGNLEQACEIAEECLHSLENFFSVSHNLTLYIIFRLAQMKQQVGCRNIMFHDILINNENHGILKRKINPGDFSLLEQNYFDETSRKYIKESIDLYVKLFYQLRKKKNYEIVFAKDLQGNLYNQKEIERLEKKRKKKKKNAFDMAYSYNLNKRINIKEDEAEEEEEEEEEANDEEDEEEDDEEEFFHEAEEDLHRIFLVIFEILKIRVISMDLNTQKLFGAKLLAIILSKNASAFVKKQTLKSDEFYKNLLYIHLKKMNGCFEGENNIYINSDTDSTDSDSKKYENKIKPEKYMYHMIDINENTEQIINSINKKNYSDNYINEVYNDNFFFQKKNADRTLNLQLTDFYLGKQKKFLDLSHPTTEYDITSIEKILFDDMYFNVEDICRYCYLRCVDETKFTENEIKHDIDFISRNEKITTGSELVQNPSEWFDQLVNRILYGKNDNLELIILMDLVKRFLTPLQKQLILYHIKLMTGFKDNNSVSDYITHILKNQKKNILYLVDTIDQKKKEFANENMLPELPHIYKKDVKSNVDFLTSLIVTNPNYFNDFPSELKHPYKNSHFLFKNNCDSFQKKDAETPHDNFPLYT